MYPLLVACSKYNIKIFIDYIFALKKKNYIIIELFHLHKNNNEIVQLLFSYTKNNTIKYKLNKKNLGIIYFLKFILNIPLNNSNNC